MSPVTAAIVGLLAGGAIGALYFLWLWWALQGLVSRHRAGPWFALNLVARLAFALVGLGLLARWGGWQVLVAGVSGFVLARIVLVRHLLGPAKGRQSL